MELKKLYWHALEESQFNAQLRLMRIDQISIMTLSISLAAHPSTFLSAGPESTEQGRVST